MRLTEFKTIHKVNPLHLAQSILQLKTKCDSAQNSQIQDSLFFSSDIKLLSIDYKNGKFEQVAKPVFMNKYESFEWDINDKYILNKLYSCKYGYCLFSDNFGGFK